MARGEAGIGKTALLEHAAASCKALLQTEGLHVVADVPANVQGLALARTLRPQIVIVDVSPAETHAFAIARRLRALPCAPTVLLTSSAAYPTVGAQLAGFGFIAKADICAEQILRHLK